MNNLVYTHRQVRKDSHLNVLLFSVYFMGALLGVDKLFPQGVYISWDSNTEPDLAGYRVYYGQSSYFFRYNIDVGLETFHSISSLPDTGMFYFAVTAYDLNGNESGFSKVVSVHIKGDAPQKTKPQFFLGKNYPNPFNPTTSIPYFLPENLFIKLAVYDLLGREVRCLEEGEKVAGDYEAFWDGMDERGIRVANGIYFCRLWIGDFCQTKKLIMTQ